MSSDGVEHDPFVAMASVQGLPWTLVSPPCRAPMVVPTSSGAVPCLDHVSDVGPFLAELVASGGVDEQTQLRSAREQVAYAGAAVVGPGARNSRSPWRTGIGDA